MGCGLQSETFDGLAFSGEKGVFHINQLLRLIFRGGTVSAYGFADYQENTMCALLDFFKDLLKAITAPGAPLPDRSCAVSARRGR